MGIRSRKICRAALSKTDSELWRWHAASLLTSTSRSYRDLRQPTLAKTQAISRPRRHRQAGAGKKAKMDSGPSKQRGRRLGARNKVKQVKDGDDEFCTQFALPSRSLPSSITDLPPSESSAESSSPSCKSTSTRKERIYALDEAKSDAAIDMAYPKNGRPAVKPKRMEALRASREQVPLAVLSLYDELKSIPPCAIPSELEVVISSANPIQLAMNDADRFQSSYNVDKDTPRKTKSLVPLCYYLPPSATPYPSQYLDRLEITVDKDFFEAAEAFKTGAHERQLGTLVSQLLFEAEPWAKKCHITTLNV